MNRRSTVVLVGIFGGFFVLFLVFLGIAFALLLLDVFLLERRTAWLTKLNLFNEKEP